MSFSVPPPTSPTPAGKPGGDEPKLLSTKDSIGQLFVRGLPGRSVFHRTEINLILRILQGKQAGWIKLETSSYGLSDGELVTDIRISRKDKKASTIKAAQSVDSAWIRFEAIGFTYSLNAAKLIVDFKNAGAEVGEDILGRAKGYLEEAEKKQETPAPKPKGKRGPKKT